MYLIHLIHCIPTRTGSLNACFRYDSSMWRVKSTVRNPWISLSGFRILCALTKPSLSLNPYVSLDVPRPPLIFGKQNLFQSFFSSPMSIFYMCPRSELLSACPRMALTNNQIFANVRLLDRLWSWKFVWSKSTWTWSTLFIIIIIINKLCYTETRYTE